MYRPLIRAPVSYARSKSGRRRTRSVRRSVSPGCLAFVGNRQALAPLGATPLQHNPAVLRRHPHPEAMGLGPAAGIRLVSTLALLRSRHLFLGRTHGARYPAPDETSMILNRSQTPQPQIPVVRASQEE